MLEALDRTSSISIATPEVVAGFDGGCKVEDETDYGRGRRNDIHDLRESMLDREDLSKREQ